MNKSMTILKTSFEKQGILNHDMATDEDLRYFTDRSNVDLPNDLVAYFKTVNGTDEKYDENYFQFYPIINFKSIEEMYADWDGVPDFKEIKDVIADYKQLFVIADYSIHVIAYAIKLWPANGPGNDVYAICGGKYDVVARSFTEFIEKYISNSSALMI